jgi:transcriptional regulator with XRE-family HTH domain
MENSMGWRFKYFRELIGLSQNRLGKDLGLPQASLSKIESGNQPPSEPVVRLMEYMFHLNRQWLLSGEGDCFLHGKTQKKAGDHLEKKRRSISGEENKDLLLEEAMDDYNLMVQEIEEKATKDEQRELDEILGRISGIHKRARARLKNVGKKASG